MPKKIKVVLSNNEVFYVTRPWYLFWLDGIGATSFLDENGKRIKFNNHWWIYQNVINESDIPEDKRRYNEVRL